MKKTSRLLKTKALHSVRRAAEAFNSLHDEGRRTAVLLHLQHALEMLLKAALHERSVRTFDPESGRSIRFSKCLNLATEKLGLTGDEVGVLRTIDALRADEQHYLAEVSEGMLYLYIRAAISVADRVLSEVFQEGLADHLPARVLPISTEPPEDLDVLIDRDYSQIAGMLRPGSRRRDEARARIRGLLALEGHVADEVAITERDVSRVERGIRSGQPRHQVFPRLAGLSTSIDGLSVRIMVQFSKREGMPVRFASDDETEAAAIREVDLQRKYRYSKQRLADLAGLTAPKAAALRAELAIDGDPACYHSFEFERTRIPRYSDEAVKRMRKALRSGVDMGAVWERHRSRRRA